LAAGKEAWLNAPEWQELRHAVEDLMVEQDWFQMLVAQDFVLNGILYPLVYERFNDKLNAAYGPLFSMLTRFQREWYAENTKWIDAQLKAAAADNDANKALLGEWIKAWRERAVKELAPVAQLAFGADAGTVMDDVVQNLNTRAAKAGIAL
jgi:phenol hydroxylase P1 protein